MDNSREAAQANIQNFFIFHLRFAEILYELDVLHSCELILKGEHKHVIRRTRWYDDVFTCEWVEKYYFMWRCTHNIKRARWYVWRFVLCAGMCFFLHKNRLFVCVCVRSYGYFFSRWRGVRVEFCTTSRELHHQRVYLIFVETIYMKHIYWVYTYTHIHGLRLEEVQKSWWHTTHTHTHVEHTSPRKVIP